ncbi:MAG: topoisomerase DNA-binding C4 zinc finger domain-containing protein [Campylobacterales bacterium]|nr:topoisomerase DNA-binding C4 zinc finger domain-containing protein [Campylobacterales bacterium]
MIKGVLISIIKNFQVFLILWVIIIVFNQAFLFGGCYASYCLISALPHTFIISSLLIYFFDVQKIGEIAENVLIITDLEIQAKKRQADILKLEEEKKKVLDDMVIQTLQNEIEQSSSKQLLIEKKEEKTSSDDTKEPLCPMCNSKMVSRTARQGIYAGNKFWGCSNFPSCKGIVNI